MALTMFDRARWTGKEPEAAVFRKWLQARLQEPTPAPPPDKKRVAKAGARPRGKSAKSGEPG
jgi:hypothetical protein